MRVLVCGGRDFCFSPTNATQKQSYVAATQHQSVWDELDDLSKTISLLIAGGAKGVDRCAELWAKSREVPHLIHPAEWKKHGRSAGPIRNQAMLDQWKPQLVIAFPGGVGTQHMVKRAKAAGIDIFEPGWKWAE